MHWYWQDVDSDDWTILFFHFQQSYDYWLMLKLRLCSIFCGPTDGVWKKNALILTKLGKDNYKLFFVIFQPSCGPWLESEFCFHLMPWEQIDGFWWNFVYAVLWLTREIFPNLSTVQFWPLNNVKISFFLSIFRNNEWILIKLCLCIDIYDPCCD